MQQQHPGFLIYDTVRLFRRSFVTRLQDLGLSEAQWRALGTIGKLEGISQTELADYLGIGKAPLGSLVDKLEQSGLISREPDATDRRIKRLYLTPTAGPITTTLRERYERLQTEFTAGISSQQQAALLKNLQKIYHNLTGNDAPALALMQLLNHIARLLSRHFDQQLKQLGFTRSQWLVLAALHSQQGISQNQLAQALHMQKAPLGALIDELEQGHWVERRTDPDDRRVRQLYLTPGCEDEWHTLNEAYETMHRKTIEGVSDKQRQQLRQCLQAIRINLKAIARPAGDPLSKSA